MSEYIKREDAISTVKHAWAKGLEPSQYIEIIPAAEVEEVKHGKWDRNPIAIVCSECGKAFGLVEMFAHYCPSCGAKMDLEE